MTWRAHHNAGLAPFLVGFLGGGLLWLAGCAGARLFEPHQQSVPVVATNASGILITNYVTITNFTVDPGVTNFLGNARTIAEAVPSPWGALAATALAITSGVLGTIAKVKSNKAALVPVLIAGIEAAGHAETKLKVKEISEAVGLDQRLATEVIKQTGS